jgi:hypothetical protein
MEISRSTSGKEGTLRKLYEEYDDYEEDEYGEEGSVGLRDSDDSDEDDDDYDDYSGTPVSPKSLERKSLRKSLGSIIGTPVKMAKRLSSSMIPGMVTGMATSPSPDNHKRRTLSLPTSPGILSPRRLSKGMSSVSAKVLTTSKHMLVHKKEPETWREACELPPNATKEEAMAILLARELDCLEL